MTLKSRGISPLPQQSSVCEAVPARYCPKILSSPAPPRIPSATAAATISSGAAEQAAGGTTSSTTQIPRGRAGSAAALLSRRAGFFTASTSAWTDLRLFQHQHPIAALALCGRDDRGAAFVREDGKDRALARAGIEPRRAELIRPGKDRKVHG